MDGLLEDLFSAYYKARKNKRHKKDQLAFEENFESSLMLLHKQITQRTFKPEHYIAFVSKTPVIREVFAPSFRDRVVHHLLYSYLSEIFESDFINDSYSCRVGKGTLYGVRRVQDMIYNCSHGYTTNCYVLKLDISGYFYSINKQILYEMCTKRMQRFFNKRKYDLVNYLLKRILFHDVTHNAVRVGNIANWKLLPPSRSLFHCAKHKGLPIGNLTSQLFSNIYMNGFDHFIQRDLNIKHYGRYVDDFIVVHKDKAFLSKLIETSANYLKHHLGLTLHPNKIYLQHYSKGVAFLGGYIKPYRIYIGKRVKTNFKAFIREIHRLFTYHCNTMHYKQLLNIRATLNSYLGMLDKFNTFDLRKRAIQSLPSCFYLYFRFKPNLRSVTLCNNLYY
jgi:retron-type reverse transcriptase